MEFTLNYGSSVSLVQHDVLASIQGGSVEAAKPLKLVTTSGEQLPIIGYIQAPIKLSELELWHEFVVGIVCLPL